MLSCDKGLYKWKVLLGVLNRKSRVDCIVIKTLEKLQIFAWAEFWFNHNEEDYQGEEELTM